MPQSDSENISMLTEETKIQGVFIYAFDRLDALNRLRLAGANAEIDELKARIASLEADNALMCESGTKELRELKAHIKSLEAEPADRVQHFADMDFALRKIFVELEPIIAKTSNRIRANLLTRIQAIVTTVLDDQPKPKEEPDEA